MPLLLAASSLAATSYYTISTLGLAAFTRGDDKALLATVSKRRPVGKSALEGTELLAADPLDQQAVSAVVAARARASGDLDRALVEVGILRQLGWRSNTALKNLLWLGGTTRNIPLLLDTLDALLRRERLLDQIYPILNLMTIDPEFRRLLVKRLSKRVSWRGYYLQSASNLTDGAQIDGRYRVMQALQAGGDRLSRNEVAPILPKLVESGRPDAAFALWRSHQRRVDTPLNDPQFTKAAAPLPTDALPVPFEWQLGSGSGYYAEASQDGDGGMLAIDWDGRGAPTFARQLTTAASGHYRLDVMGEAPISATLSKVGFRLVCRSGEVVEFTPEAVGNGRRARLISGERVPCGYPELQLYGLVQPGTSGGSIVFRGIHLARSGT